MMRPRAFVAAAALIGVACAIACAPPPKPNQFGNFLKQRPEPTDSAITERDLRTRMYVFSDDSMMGRQTGRDGNLKATSYIARELTRLGITPAGDNGTYFQNMPWVARHYAATSTLTVGGRPLRWLADWASVPGANPSKGFDGVRAVYGGVAGDTSKQITSQQAQGKLVILSTGAPVAGGNAAQAVRLGGSAAVAVVDLQNLNTNSRALYVNPPAALVDPAAPVAAASASLRLTPEAASAVLGASVDGMRAGTEGGTVSAKLDLVETPVPQFGRNVIGVIKGSDSKLAGEYVAIGAHSDHVGYNAAPVDHDSAHAVQSALLKMQIQGNELKALTPAQIASVKINLDSMRKLAKPRMDSIFNGADDDGSGTVAVLEIAEEIAMNPVKPRRSILFVWHTGEERGLLGSRWFTDHPTVPRDSIVTQINIDQIGRGRADEIPGGGSDYMAVVGSFRLSTDLGREVVKVNLEQPNPLRIDYRLDDPISWPGYNNIYMRSDHYNYARFGIPIAFFSTGLHQDYHRVTDEAQYIDFPHLTNITRYLRALVVDVANLEKKPVVDKKP
jgi:hypothetical protein